MPETIKVVMVDDESDLCFVVKSNLEEKGGYEVVTTSDPNEAEDVIRREQPNIVLLDVVMPQRGGQDIVTSLKKQDDLKKIPIVMVSGKGEMVFDKKKGEFKWMPNNPAAKDRGELPDAKGAEALAEAYGVDDYISKPFTTDLLVQVIGEVLAKYSAKDKDDDDGGIGLGAV